MVTIIDHSKDVKAEQLTKNVKKTEAPVVVERETREIVKLGENVEAVVVSFNVDNEANIPTLIRELMQRKFQNVQRDGVEPEIKLNKVSPGALMQQLEAAGFPLRGADWVKKGQNKFAWNTLFTRHPKKDGAMKEFTAVKKDAFEEAIMLLNGKGISAMILNCPFFEDGKEVDGKRCIVVACGMYSWTTPNKELRIENNAIAVEGPKVTA